MLRSNSGVLDEGKYACFYADGSRTLEQFDQRILDLFADRDAQAYFIPALIKGDVLSRCGCFESFPEQVMRVGFLGQKHLDEVAETGTLLPEYFVPQDLYLTPAACLHIYPMFQGRLLNRNVTVTTRARVYRHETKEGTPLTRLWDFTVREFVFLGDADYVHESLKLASERAQRLARENFRKVDVVAAQDSFHPTALNFVKAKFQKANSRKFELTVRVSEQSIAVASFNFHGTHFSAAFNFDADRRVVTGCAGFGLERWAGAQRLEQSTGP